MGSDKFMVKLYFLSFLKQTHILMNESAECVLLQLRSLIDGHDERLRTAWNSRLALAVSSEVSAAA